MKNIGIATLFAVLIIGMPLLPALAQSSTDHHPVADQPVATQMSMGGMMDNCQKDCHAASAALDEITRTIAEAKTSNDVSKLHAALDQVQERVSAMSGQMTECRDMMSMMPQMMSMPGRGGMMNQPAR
jgi:hypothetical protein